MAHNKNNPILGKGKPKEKKGTFGFACRNGVRPGEEEVVGLVWFGLEPKNPMFRTQSPNPHKIKNEKRRKDKSKETKEQTDEEVEEEDRVCFAAYDGGRAHEVSGFQAWARLH